AVRHRAQRGPGEAGAPVEVATVAVDERLRGELLLGRPGRLADPRQLGLRVRVAAGPRLGGREVALSALALELGDDRRNSDEGRDLFRMRLRVEQPERSAPRVADQRELLAAQARALVVDDRVEVGEVARDRELLGVRARIVRAPRAALVP